MRRRSWFVTLSALPLGLAGLLALWAGSLASQSERNDAGVWAAFGVVALVTALLVTLGVTWAFILEGLVGLLVGAWFGVVLLFSILFMGDPDVGAPTLDTFIGFAGLFVGLGASWWIVRAAVVGWRGRGQAAGHEANRGEAAIDRTSGSGS